MIEESDGDDDDEWGDPLPSKKADEKKIRKKEKTDKGPMWGDALSKSKSKASHPIKEKEKVQEMPRGRKVTPSNMKTMTHQEDMDKEKEKPAIVSHGGAQRFPVPRSRSRSGGRKSDRMEVSHDDRFGGLAPQSGASPESSPSDSASSSFSDSDSSGASPEEEELEEEDHDDDEDEGEGEEEAKLEMDRNKAMGKVRHRRTRTLSKGVRPASHSELVHSTSEFAETLRLTIQLPDGSEVRSLLSLLS